MVIGLILDPVNLTTLMPHAVTAAPVIALISMFFTWYCVEPYGDEKYLSLRFSMFGALIYWNNYRGILVDRNQESWFDHVENNNFHKPIQARGEHRFAGQDHQSGQ